MFSRWLLTEEVCGLSNQKFWWWIHLPALWSSTMGPIRVQWTTLAIYSCASSGYNWIWTNAQSAVSFQQVVGCEWEFAYSHPCEKCSTHTTVNPIVTLCTMYGTGCRKFIVTGFIHASGFASDRWFWYRKSKKKSIQSRKGTRPYHPCRISRNADLLPEPLRGGSILGYAKPVEDIVFSAKFGSGHSISSNATLKWNDISSLEWTWTRQIGGWLDAHHSFSFANWYDPSKVHFGLLRVLNDDIAAGGPGFRMHPHNDMRLSPSSWKEHRTSRQYGQWICNPTRRCAGDEWNWCLSFWIQSIENRPNKPLSTVDFSKRKWHRFPGMIKTFDKGSGEQYSDSCVRFQKKKEWWIIHSSGCGSFTE